MIEFKNVHFAFKDRTIFRDLNVKISTGSLNWLQGENGQGKTTFLRLILDFLKPQSGEIIMPSTVQMGWGPAVDNSFFPRLTGEQNLRFFSGLSGKGYDASKWFFSLISNDELLDRVLKTPFYQMSSGMKQLLILMRSLLMNPDLILLDEPMRGLDSTHQASFQKMVKSLIEMKKTILITSHLPIDLGVSQIRTMKIHDYQIH